MKRTPNTSYSNGDLVEIRRRMFCAVVGGTSGPSESLRIPTDGLIVDGTVTWMEIFSPDADNRTTWPPVKREVLPSKRGYVRVIDG